MNAVDCSIEEEKASLLLELQQRYSEINIENVVIASKQIELLIEYKILDRVLFYLGRIFGDKQIGHDGCYFKYHGNIFELSVAEDIRNRGTLLCSCIARSVDKQPRSCQIEFPLS